MYSTSKTENNIEIYIINRPSSDGLFFCIMEKIKTYLSSHKDRLLLILQSNIPDYFAQSEKKDFANYLDHEREDYFIIMDKDAIVGCGGINYDHDKNIAIISWDIIDRDYHGKGLGGKLLSYRLAHITDNYPSYTIRVRTAQNTFKFYEKYGFELKYTQKDYWALGYDLYYMERLSG